MDSAITLYPVEDGTIISDNISQGTKRLKISGLISTVDAGGGFGIAATLGFGSDDKSAKLVDIMETIERIHDAREIITVSTGQLIYRDMAFSSISAKRSNNEGGGNWLAIDAEMINIRKVKLKSADAPPAEQVAPPAQGRSGATNQPAGANANGGNTPQADNGRGRSALVSLRNTIRDSPTAGRIGDAVRNGLGGLLGR